MAIIGNGAQAEFQALAFKTLCGIDRLRLYDVDRAASEKCARNLSGFGFDIFIAASVAQQAGGRIASRLVVRWAARAGGSRIRPGPAAGSARSAP